ncbi:MAG TPA: type I DNA topoisomerase [Saprospiraceae bacterium]|nr:type I DNA topoisomerase [Saprospiraceae bacterium]
MAKNLLIVESPAKAKTIEKYLGKDFVVKSSYGHIRDLEKGNQAVDIENNFQPKYTISKEKKKTVKELKDWVKKVDEVWLATDEDREGEAISWHLCHVLGLDIDDTKRIVFREITKPAIQKAIQNPGKVDKNLVNAQQARRILDRLVGFELSEILWKKIRSRLSAGRVQSVAVKLIVEKEREIQDFKPEEYYRVVAHFELNSQDGKKDQLKANLSDQLSTKEEAEELLGQCSKAEFTIDDIKVKPSKRRPAPPFTTSTLQQEASRKLYFNVNRTMRVAQSLYEKGLITYMRTDSIALSETAIKSLAEQITDEFGEKYLKTRRYKNKKSNAQEAHEAIRPTYADRNSAGGNEDERKLYNLIRKRALASQMADAELEKTTVKIDISTTNDYYLTAKGEVLIFDGFLKVYLESTDDEEEEKAGILPPLKVGQKLDMDFMEATQRFTRPPSRYTEAGLVKKLEELGIGRPSTYAPTISKIMEEKRGYVVKAQLEGHDRNYFQLTVRPGEKLEQETKTERTGVVKNRLMGTDLGMIVSDFLDKHFVEIMQYDFTANIEEDFDEIARGSKDWVSMLNEFYKAFHENVEKTKEHADRASGERILGKDPKSGRTLLVRMSRFGPVAQIGQPDELEEDEKPRYANLRKDQSLHTITEEDALDLFKLPRLLGDYEGKEVMAGIGRYGPYIRFDDKFVSIPKGEDPLSITLDRGIELIEQKRKEDRPIMEYDGEPVTKGRGRFGPYLKYKKLFVNVPKSIDFDNIDDETARELIAKKIQKEAERYIQQWDDLDLSVQNGRWGPFIKFKKKNVKIPKGKDGKRMTREEAAELTLEDVKKLVEAEIPGAFDKKKGKKKTAKKKTAKKK